LLKQYLKEGVGVSLRKHKSRSKLGIVKPENRLLGLLGRKRTFRASFYDIGKGCQVSYGKSKKETGNALLEAEYNKAKANMAAQQIRSVC
jgi:hypothetical protein